MLTLTLNHDVTMEYKSCSILFNLALIGQLLQVFCADLVSEGLGAWAYGAPTA